MSEIAEPTEAAAAPPAPIGAPETPPAPVVGEGNSPPTGDLNPYETKFGTTFNPDGSLKEGWTDALAPELGLDDGRKARLARQTSWDGILKALDGAQTQLEKRDGAGTFVPDPANEIAFNEWRDSQGIPRDPADPENGYDFRAGMPEGAEFDQDLADQVAPLLHGANLSKEKAREISEAYNAHQVKLEGLKKEAETKMQTEHEHEVYTHFQKEWGAEFDAKNADVTRMVESYDLDFENARDRAALTNPKVVSALADLAAFSRNLAPTPEGGQGEGNSMSPRQRAEQIMADNPRTWDKVPELHSRVTALMKQARD